MNNVIDFLKYKEQTEILEEPVRQELDIFDLMTDEEIDFLLDELSNYFRMDEPANDYGLPKKPLGQPFYETPSFEGDDY